MRPTRALLRTGRAIWLLEIDALGRTWRWASEPVDVTDARAGETWPYAGGLPRIELAVAVDPGQPVAEPQPVTIDLTWPDVQLALARGVVLRGSARLSWWVVGSDYQERLQLLTGTISASEHDYSGAPVRVTVASDIADEGGLVPDPTQAVTAEAWPISGSSPGGVPQSSVDLAYPVVFGSPGGVAVSDPASAVYGARFAYPGSPAVPVESSLTISGAGDRVFSASTLLVCTGRVDAATVLIAYPSTSGSGSGWLFEAFNVNIEADALGRTVSTCNVASSTAGAALEQADSLWVAWTSDYTDRQLAVIGEDGQPVIGAGGVIDWMMRRSTVPYEPAAWLGVRSALDAYGVDTYLDEPVGPWTWVAEVLLPALPVSVLPAGDGLRPVLWRPDATADDVLAHFVTESNCARSSGVRTRSEAESTVTVEYGANADNGDTQGAFSFAPEPDVAAGIASCAWARAARDLSGRVGSDTVAAGWTTDRATAAALAAWRLALAAGWLEVDLDVPQEWGWLALGDPVAVTDGTVGLASEVGQIAGITYRDAGVLSLRIVLWRVAALSSSAIPMGPSDTPVETPQ